MKDKLVSLLLGVACALTIIILAQEAARAQSVDLGPTFSTGGGGGGGGVTSVGLILPSSVFNVSNSPITTSGDILGTFKTQSANTVFAGPASGGAATPTFRALVSEDIPFPLSMPGGGTAVAPTLAFPGSGIYSQSFGILNFETSGVERLRIDNNGDIVLAPGGSGSLTVNGDGIFTGNISAANFPTPITGSANHIASYDAGGALASSIMTTTENNTIYASPANPTTGDYVGIGLDTNGVGPGYYTGININNSMTTTNGLTLVNLYNSGDSAQNFNGIALFNVGNITTGLNMEVVNNSGSVGGQIRLMEASNSGTANGGILYNLFNQSTGVMTGQFSILNMGDAAVTNGNWQGMNINKTGNVTGAVGGIGFSLDADATSDVNMMSLGQNNAHTYGASFTGINVYTSSGTTITNNATMMYLSDNSASNGKTGLNVNLQGTTSSYVQGITVNVTNVTGYNQQPEAISTQGGMLNVSSPYDTATLTPSLVFGNNSLGGELHISAGFPISGAFGFGNNLGITLFAEDNMAADSFLGSSSLGFSINGFVNQLGVVSGKTVDTVNYMAAGGQFPPGSTGGTITNLSLFRALGILNGGGTLNITNLWGFKAEDTLCSASPTNCYGVWIGDPLAQNWFTGGVTLATSTTQPTCDVTRRGMMWNIEGGAGVADILQVCQKTVLNTYAWVTH